MLKNPSTWLRAALCEIIPPTGTTQLLLTKKTVAQFGELVAQGSEVFASYNWNMVRVLPSAIPIGLKPYFQEYNIARLDLERDANLIIQRTLEFGTWDELRWLFETYRSKRIRLFLRQYGERQLKPVTFNYWRKLLNIRRWKKSPFVVERGELWNH